MTHLDHDEGFWCINDEQPKDETCADFEVRFCCPEEYTDPCSGSGLFCAENQHILYQVQGYHGISKTAIAEIYILLFDRKF